MIEVSEENNINNTEEGISINGVDDIKHVLLSSKLTLSNANQIFKSPLKDEFIVTFYILLTTTDLHSTTKVLFLVGCFENKFYDLAKSLLETERFTFVEILKCIKILDSKRALKALRKKYDAMITKEAERQKRIKAISDEYLKKKEEEKKKDVVDQDDNNNNNNSNVNIVEKKEEEKESVEKKDTEKGKKKEKKNNNNNEKNNKKKAINEKKRNTKTATVEATVTEESKALLPVEVQKSVDKVKREAKFKKCYERSKSNMERKITELEQLFCTASLCGSVSRIFKNWFKTITPKTLEYFALGQPKETWKELADLLHLSPSDFQIPWFLEFMFGKAAPEGSSVHDFDDAKSRADAGELVNYVPLLEKHRPPYSFLRKRLTEDELKPLKMQIAQYEDINLVLWWFHEFKDVKGINQLVVQRVNTGDLTLAYGTLIEKTMSLTEDSNPAMKPIFDSLLKATLTKLTKFATRFSLPPPIAVFGDRSGSMDIAIRLATIIGYLVSNLSEGSRLSFFNTEDMEAPVPPSSIGQLFKLTSLVTAEGGTAPAISLKPYLDEKKPLKYVVVVTDEEENQSVDRMEFAAMFDKYRREVAPDCKPVFVSFLRSNAKGYMVTQLKRNHQIDPIQIVLDRSKPDVTKIDQMLTALSCESPLFKTQHELLTKVFNLFDNKFFSKYISENKKNLFSYSFNSEIVLMILRNLFGFYLKKLPADDANLSFFKARVFNESNCLQMINENLKQLLVVTKQCELNSLVSFVEEAIKTFNSLQRQQSVEFLDKLFNSLNKDVLSRPADIAAANKVLSMDSDLVNNNNNNNNSDSSIKDSEELLEFKDKLVSGELTIPEAVRMLQNSYVKDKFIPVYLMLLNSIDLVSKVKINVLCAAFECKLYTFAQLILYNKKYGFKEVSKAIKVLDSGRMVRQLQMKLEKCKLNHDQRLERLKKASEEYLAKKKEIQKDENNNNNDDSEKKDEQSTTTTTSTTPAEKKEVKPKGAAKGKGKGKGRGKGKGKGKGADGDKEDGEKKKFKEKLKSGKLTPLEKKQREKIFEANYESSIKAMETKIEQAKKHGSNGSLSGNIIKMFKKWLKTFPEKALEYFALGQPKEVWREMADLLHLSAKDFQADWFLPSCYNKEHTGESINAFAPTDLSDEQLKQLIVKYKPSYSYIRKRIDPSTMSDELRLIIANYEDLSIVLWWYHELASFDVDNAIARRLANNELGAISLGTLLERAIHFQQQGIPLFRDILPIIRNAFAVFSKRIALPPPLMTLGDASNSMDVAIKISTIIASLVTSLTDNASLRFFNHAPLWAPLDPTSLTDVFNVANIIQGSGSTSPAAGLYPIYENGQVLRYLVMVTDEEENSNYKSYNFLKLYQEYIAKVAPNCKLVFVSFLRQNEEGQMTTQLKEAGIVPLQFCLDKNRPDVTKIDDLITTLSCHSDSFSHQMDAFEYMIKLFGEKYFYGFVNSDKFFVESYTYETLVHILDILAKFVEGSLIDDNKNQELVDKLLELTNKRDMISIITEVVNKIKYSNGVEQYEQLQESIGQIEKLLPSSNSDIAIFQQFESIVNRMKSNVNLFKTTTELKTIKEQSEVENNNNSKSVESAAGSQEIFKVGNIKFEREFGTLTEYDVNTLFSYVEDLEVLKNCSLVSKLWRKCTMNPQHWTRFMNVKDIRKLDLVFVVDDTGSMGSEIAKVKQEIQNIVDDIVSIGSIEVRVAMVFYNDHTPNSDHSKSVCKVFKFTSDIPELRRGLDSVVVHGGADHPEAMADGFYEVTKLDFAKSSTKVCIVIGDAPPHGFSGSGDSFPQGCPCGHDLIASVRQLVQGGVTFYTVMCRGDSQTYETLNAIADLSEGRFVLLNNASELTEIITGSAKASILLDTIAEEVLKEIEMWQLKMPHIAKEEAIYRASYSLRSRGIKVPKRKSASSSPANTSYDKSSIYQAIMKSDNHAEYQVNSAQLKANGSTNKKKVSKASSATATTKSDENQVELITIDHVRKIAKKNHII
ncbi:hypothetical protein PPL_05180 [Heterostelium album PN500]|uniref:VWFA domain-containing protein n=1 Tax=Heterostelium pallidum (strain ATCC 26659 / Pp 5 / PN500) TaxID=670386 RepID=D3B9N4_HETP5|nr:hypothetical protein PPL_05180 [Heterostelium album PN500]EFA81946.1 hypothetical protein PPL_05180 [Heterostelium album PN500]|eukprot:XP_020434063.1 hypothetical protein PPL_05180 [Heterostelium album PN500]